MNFTDAQRSVIDLRGRNILVSAAAGSGKTATLTQRLIGLLTDPDDPADISRMLVVTFTRAAAGELRSRVSSALGAALALSPGDRRLSRQLTSLGGAHICTIDSYYLDVVRANFQRLGLPASFRLADESELDVMRREVMNDTVEHFYREDDAFGSFADCLTGGGNDGKLADILIDLAVKFNSDPGGTRALDTFADLAESEAEQDFYASRAGKAAKERMTVLLSDIIARCRDALHDAVADPAITPYVPALESDLGFADSLLNAVMSGDYGESRRVVTDYSPLSLGRIKAADKSEATEAFKALRGQVKKQLQSFAAREFAQPEEGVTLLQRQSAILYRKMRQVLDGYTAAYDEEKSSRAVLEFADLRRHALALLVSPDGTPSDIARAEQAKYTHIFVDEYQDTDGVQDAIFRAVSRGDNLFMVGDIKQSIYSFRGADPSVFAAYRRDYRPYDPSNDPEPSSPCSVYMSENFRCAQRIIDFANAVCSYVFAQTERGAPGSGIGYRPEDDLVFARGGAPDIPVRLVLIDNTKEAPDADTVDAGAADADTAGAGNDADGDAVAPDVTDESSSGTVNPEIRYVVGEISRLLREGSCRPGDIAVLSRSNSKASEVAAALARAGIPHANSVGEDLFENPEVLLMFSLLSACDNPQRDVPLTGALRSPLFGFTLTDLVRIRAGNNRVSLYDSLSEYAGGGDEPELASRCRDALDRIDRYRADAEALPVHRFIRRLWRDTNALSYAGSSSESRRRTPVERRRNLQRLYEYARTYEASSFRGLHDFVAYVGGIIGEGIKIRTEDAADDGTVRVMSVHKSKGLEFKTVFLIGAASPFNKSDERENAVYTRSGNIGMTLRLTDPTGFGRTDTPMRLAAADRVSDLNSEEEARILYVALTRACDRLYVVASGTGDFSSKRLDAAERRAAVGGRAAMLAAGSWADWILTALAGGRGAGSYELTLLQANMIPDIAGTTDTPPPDGGSPVYDTARVAGMTAGILSRFGYEYPYSAVADMPAKLSVSRLYPDALSEEGDTAADTPAAVAALLSERADGYAPRLPRFMGGSDADDAAARGTATHLFLQFCDFSHLDGSVDAVAEEAARLTTEKFIPEKAASLVRTDEIATFSRSDFFASVRSAVSVRREQRFNILLPAADFTTDEARKALLADEMLLVQGVIDLFFTDKDGQLVLCDYKTDRLSPAERAAPVLAAAKMSERHGVQLSYYASALERMTGHRPDRICVFSLHMGRALDITLPEQRKV